jgi:hypothetical protein
MTSTVVMRTEPTTCASLDFCSQVGSASALSITVFLRAFFLNGGPWHRLWEKVFIPGVVSDGWQGVEESDRRLAGPVDVNRFSVSPG